MGGHAGLWLFLAVLGFYLADSAVPLFHDELALQAWRGRVVASAGSTLELAGRQVFVPNPLTPFKPVFRVAWAAPPIPMRRLERQRLQLTLAQLAPWIMVLFVLFFPGLPFAWFVPHRDVALLIWLLLVYIVVIAMLVFVYRHRQALKLSPAAVWALAADVLLCVPFALNLVRKISLRQGNCVDLCDMARSMDRQHDLPRLLALLRSRVVFGLSFVESGSVREHALRDCQAWLERQSP